MDFKIIADSGCDVNEEVKEMTYISLVPIKLSLGSQEFIDDEQLDIGHFLSELKKSPIAPKSSSPSPFEFMKKMKDANHIFVVTLSSQISSSYDHAVLAKNMFMEEYGNKFIHVFDSLTASVGETLVGLKINELAKKNFGDMEIVEKVTQYIKEMNTFFLLESINNLMKSGRLNKLQGTLASVLNIKPILGSSRKGTIELIEKVRGSKKAFKRFIDLIGEKGEKLEEKILGIAHCNNLEKALHLRDEVLKKYRFKEIIIVEMGPTISAYADEGGLLVSF